MKAAASGMGGMAGMPGMTNEPMKTPPTNTPPVKTNKTPVEAPADKGMADMPGMGAKK
jgi:hypothetical protein